MTEGKAASTNKRLLGKSGLKNASGKSDRSATLTDPPAQPPKCPECTSQRVWKDGLRKTRHGDVQRWLCRNCGYRFSETVEKIDVFRKSGVETADSMNKLAETSIRTRDLALKEVFNKSSLTLGENVGSHSKSTNIPIVGKDLYALPSNSRNCQVCASESEAKNLSQQQKTRQKQAAGATKYDAATIKGKIVEFAFWLDKQGYPEGTRKRRVNNIKRLVDLGADLWNPETTKEILAKHKEWKNSYKGLLCYAYESFLQMEGLTWERPKYKKTQTLPFTPMETELDQLIASCGKKVSTFLQGLKDTGADPGELAKLRWIDINKQSRTVNIRPVKGHNPRILPVSNDFINRLERMCRKGERVFNNQESLNSMFYRQRKRLAYKLSNPRLLEISFTTFRHWKGTMEYHKTKDILHVKHLLGHKNIQNTMIYIDLETVLFNRTNDEFIVRVAHNVKEACDLVEASFEYVTGEYNDGGKIFRKRK